MNTSDAATLCISLMTKHGLMTENTNSWRFEFDNAKRRLGVCNYRDRVIGLSRPLVEHNSLDVIQDTILHEIAHALTPHAGHGRMWQLQCMALGAKPQACATASDGVVSAPGKYVATCAGCQKKFYRYRRPTSIKPKACGACCHGRFDARFILHFEVSM